MASDRQFAWDPDFAGFGVQTMPSGKQSFVYQYRAGGVSRRMKLDGGWFRYEAARTNKDAPAIKGTPRAVARREAEAARGAIAQGRDPLAEMKRAANAHKSTLKAIGDDYLAKEAKNLRSVGQRRDHLERLVYPTLGSRPIDEIRRSEIVSLLDKVDEGSGPVMADAVLATLRRLMSWHASRSDDFRSPIIRGMARTKPTERRRQRVLNDDEFREVWKTSQANSNPFDYLVRFILLTCCRRNEAADLARREMTAEGALIPGSRHKSKKDFLLPLTSPALAVLNAVPKIGRSNSGAFFTTDGKKPIRGFSKFNKDFDKRCGAKGWTLHDLRRTSRSLMSRAGVDPDHAERVLGHAMPGIRGTYDVYEFRKEKLAALDKLAGQITLILFPPEKVTPLRRRL